MFKKLLLIFIIFYLAKGISFGQKAFKIILVNHNVIAEADLLAFQKAFVLKNKSVTINDITIYSQNGPEKLDIKRRQKIKLTKKNIDCSLINSICDEINNANFKLLYNQDWSNLDDYANLAPKKIDLSNNKSITEMINVLNNELKSLDYSQRNVIIFLSNTGLNLNWQVMLIDNSFVLQKDPDNKLFKDQLQVEPYEKLDLIFQGKNKAYVKLKPEIDDIEIPVTLTYTDRLGCIHTDTGKLYGKDRGPDYPVNIVFPSCNEAKYKDLTIGGEKGNCRYVRIDEPTGSFVQIFKPSGSAGSDYSILLENATKTVQFDISGLTEEGKWEEIKTGFAVTSVPNPLCGFSEFRLNEEKLKKAGFDFVKYKIKVTNRQEGSRKASTSNEHLVVFSPC